MHDLNTPTHIHRVFHCRAEGIAGDALHNVLSAAHWVDPSAAKAPAEVLAEVVVIARRAVEELEALEERYGLGDGYPGQDELEASLAAGEL
jgi:hypothetical protein